MAAARKRIATLALAGFIGAGLIGGCATGSDDEDGGGAFALPKMSDLNPFAISKTPLPGKRISVLTTEDQVNGRLAEATGSLVIPPVYEATDWATPGGVPSNAPGHLSLPGQLRTVWQASAGTGSSSAAKLTAVPLVHQGRVYVFDAANQLSAFSTSGGGKAFAISVAPEGVKGDKAFGGGIAAEGGRIFAATGFGTVVAFDASNGARLWEKKLGAPFRASPTVADGRVFVTNTDGQVAALQAGDGSVLWTFHGTPQQTAALLSNARPAVAGDTVVVPFTSGDLVALKVDSGAAVWSENVNGSKSASSLASLSDPASPVVNGGTIYAASRAGRMIASNADTGERTWSMNLGGIDTPWVAGDAIYVVDATGRLVALQRANGEVRWAVKLPGNAKVWSGPVLAGGRLWLTSSKGALVGVDPASGQVSAERPLGGPVYISPVVAAGRMYVLTDAANLMALE